MEIFVYTIIFLSGFFIAVFIISVVRSGAECDAEMLFYFIEQMRKDMINVEENNKYLKIANEQLQEELNKCARGK